MKTNDNFCWRLCGPLYWLPLYWLPRYWLLGGMVLIGAFAPAQSPVAAQIPRTDLQTKASVERMLADVTFLASDDLRGRGTDDDSIDAAAEYIHAQMVDGGFEASSLDGGSFQPLSINLGIAAGPADQNSVRITNDDGTPVLMAGLGDGMMPMAIGSDRAIVSGPLAFVGYGIKAPEFQYDDFAGLDVRGAVVMLIRKEPGANDPASPFDGTKTTRHALFTEKIERAIEAGASAVLLVNDPASTADATELVERNRALERRRIDDLEAQLISLPDDAVQTRNRLRIEMDRSSAALASTQADVDAAARGVLDLVAAGNRSKSTGTIPVASIGRDVADRLIGLRTAGPAGARTLVELERSIDARDADGKHTPKVLCLPASRRVSRWH